MAIPSPLTQDTDSAPITEQMVMYTRMLVWPWRGPTTNMKMKATMITRVAKNKNPGSGRGDVLNQIHVFKYAYCK